MDPFEGLDPSQKFRQIEIESQHETVTLKSVNLQESVDKLMQIVNEMNESKFYKHIDIFFGTKTKDKVNYLEEHYNKQIDYLYRSLQEQKQYLKGIVQAQSEQQLTLKELTHQRNQLINKKKIQSRLNPNYIPCIYVKSQRKGPLFGTIQQDINKHGAGTLSAQMGYRSPFKKYDNLQFNLEWPLQTRLNKRYYQFGLSWNNPIKKYGQFFVKYNSGNDPIYDNIDANSNGFSCGLSKGKENYEIQWSYRIPFIHANTTNQIRKGFYHPSTKFSVKYNRILEDSLKFNSVAEGKFAQVKSQLGLPLIGDSQFLKVSYNQKNYFDTFKFRSNFDNEWIRKSLWKSTIQTNFAATTIAQFGRKHFINDALEPVDVRGFHNHRRPIASYANLRGSIKFNIHNYPYLSQANIVYFLYGQAGLSFLKNQQLTKPFALGSLGLGLSLNFGPAQLQLLCNLGQYQNKRLREPTGFQFRFSIND